MNKENLYLKFVSKYTDDELLKSIENPSNLDKHVYNAILTVSLDRQLISTKQFNELFDNTNIIRFETTKDKEEIQVNAEDFWKCPKCGQTVEMNFEACWNCQNFKPEKIEHPIKAKIMDYQSDEKTFNFFKAGFRLIGIGILVLILSYLMTIPDFFGFHYLPIGKFLIGLAFIVIGLIFLVFGAFAKDPSNVD